MRKLIKKQIFPQVVDTLFSVPWGHNRFIIDKCYADPQKAFFLCKGTLPSIEDIENELIEVSKQ